MLNVDYSKAEFKKIKMEAGDSKNQLFNLFLTHKQQTKVLTNPVAFQDKKKTENATNTILPINPFSNSSLSYNYTENSNDMHEIVLHTS